MIGELFPVWTGTLHCICQEMRQKDELKRQETEGRQERGYELQDIFSECHDIPALHGPPVPPHPSSPTHAPA